MRSTTSLTIGLPLFGLQLAAGDRRVEKTHTARGGLAPSSRIHPTVSVDGEIEPVLQEPPRHRGAHDAEAQEGDAFYAGKYTARHAS
jgi:hypothetical protein